MTNEANNILKQANQGSVAAIIQVMNEKLADSGVRTRAIFDEGVLQVLCEAETLDQLEPTSLVERIRQVLEAIAPRHVRRVNINSRIVREQQLLWLEEIKRDPEQQLLWSKEITLKKANPAQQLLKDWTNRATDSAAALPQLSPRRLREKRVFWRGLMGGAGVSVLLLISGLALYQWLGSQTSRAPVKAPANTAAATGTTSTTSPVKPSPIAPTTPTSQSPDPFVNAVRMAERASQDGLKATSSAQWLELAARWQQASDLMASVPADDQRYKTAQDRVIAYRKNSESALQEAEKRKVEVPNDLSSQSSMADDQSQ